MDPQIPLGPSYFASTSSLNNSSINRTSINHTTPSRKLTIDGLTDVENSVSSKLTMQTDEN